jgi:N-acetyl-gamma-glutamylphosphate reductase
MQKSLKFDIFDKLQLGSHLVALAEYTFTHKQYTEQHKTIHRTAQKFARAWVVPHLYGFYRGICLTTGEKERKNLSQGNKRLPGGMKKICKHTI